MASTSGYSPVVGTRTANTCDCATCRESRRPPRVKKEAIAKAEALLRRFLSDEQIDQWERYQSILVEGDTKEVFRLTPGFYPAHNSVVRKVDELGISVWPIGLTIAADWVLAMMLYLQNDADLVVNSGCKSWVRWHDQGLPV